MTERPYHHGNLRTALLEEAERTVRDQGIDQLSLRALAREVGVSHAAPRRHFPDRQALLDALAEAGFARLGEELRGAVDAAGPDFEAQLQAAAAAYTRFATEDAALLELMFASKHQAPSAQLEQAGERAFSVILGLIERGQAVGALPAGEPERVGLLLFATMQGIAALVAGGMVGADQRDELVADAVAHFIAGSRA